MSRKGRCEQYTPALRFEVPLGSLSQPGRGADVMAILEEGWKQYYVI